VSRSRVTSHPSAQPGQRQAAQGASELWYAGDRGLESKRCCGTEGVWRSADWGIHFGREFRDGPTERLLARRQTSLTARPRAARVSLPEQEDRGERVHGCRTRLSSECIAHTRSQLTIDPRCGAVIIAQIVTRQHACLRAQSLMTEIEYTTMRCRDSSVRTTKPRPPRKG
jgi:hypothetical protein